MPCLSFITTPRKAALQHKNVNQGMEGGFKSPPPTGGGEAWVHMHMHALYENKDERYKQMSPWLGVCKPRQARGGDTR